MGELWLNGGWRGVSVDGLMLEQGLAATEEAASLADRYVLVERI